MKQQPKLDLSRAKRMGAALRYAKRGWYVLPLFGVTDGVCDCGLKDSCKSAGKHPITEHGVKDATRNLKRIRKLWTKHPNANVGVATGEISGIVVVDVDPRNGGNERFRKLKKQFGGLERAPKSRTGSGGCHLFFSWEQALKTCRLGGVDIQSDGAFVVVPPSEHASGRSYSWERALSKFRELPALPASWVTGTGERRTVPAKTSDGTVLEGSRNDYLTSVAGGMRNTGMGAPELLVALTAINQQKCKPPLEDDEVARIASSVAQYAPKASTGDVAEDLADLVLGETYGAGKLLIYAPDDRFWWFDAKKWTQIPEKLVEQKLLHARPRVNGRQAAMSTVSQALSLIRIKTARADDVLRFRSEPPPVINCANGEVWLSPKGEADLRPHKPESYLRHCLPIDYDPEATCPKFERAQEEIFALADQPDQMIRTWNEIMGYAIQPRRPIPIILIGRGEGSNGKTMLMNILVELMGYDLVLALKVSKIDQSRFGTAGLLGKYLVYDDDVAAGTRLPDGDLKKISEEKLMTGERKFGDPFEFVSRAMPVLLCNGSPSLGDLSPGMRRRLAVVQFARIFTEEESNRNLGRYIKRKELSGVLNRALDGLKRVVGRGWAFDFPAEMIKARDAFFVEANPVPAFVDECCERSGIAYLSDLYKAYRDYAQSAGITLHQQRPAFSRSLRHLGFRDRHGKRGQLFDGISLKRRSAPPPGH